MQVFKVYFKILRKNIFQFILYISIFSGVLFGAIVPNRVSDDNSYASIKVSYALMDNDNSKLSKSLSDYLMKAHNYCEIADFELTTMQDELYNRNIRAAVVLEKGFEEGFYNGNASAYMTVYDIPDNWAPKVFTNSVNEYMGYLEHYVSAGYTLDEAVELVDNIIFESVDAEIYGDSLTANQPAIYYFYLYLPWIFLVMMVNAVAPVLMKIDDLEVKKRLACSSYKFSGVNVEILGATCMIGAIICAIFYILSKITLSGEKVNAQYLLNINMGIMMIVALSVTFLISKIVKNVMIISMVSNIVALGMAFLSGVFVPMEFLGDNVIKAAHFLPTYWYVNALDSITNYNASKFNTILQYFGIELLFAVVIIMVALIFANQDRKTA